ncbi:hypothetical protein ACLOJK_009748 [Asimina triloba]
MQLEELSRKLKQEANRELNQERRRVLNQQQRESERRQREIEETIRTLKEESEKQLREERRKAREAAQREMRLRALQTEIVAQLKITVGQSTGVRNILQSRLAGRRFLLILKDVWEYIDLQGIGIPPPTPGNGSKVIIIPTAEVVQGQMRAVVIQEDFSSLSESQASQLLNAEAMDVATTLPPSFPNIAGTIIFECFSYVSLFPRSAPGMVLDGSSLKEFWRWMAPLVSGSHSFIRKFAGWD